jgi:hypothetical protein
VACLSSALPIWVPAPVALNAAGASPSRRRACRRRLGALSGSRGSLEDLRDHLHRQNYKLVRLESVEADQG